jgi:hypothetical protein
MTMLVPLPTAPPAEVARRWLTNRQALFVLIALVAVLATAFGGLLSSAVADLRDGLRYLGHGAGPQVMVTSDLHLALSDMDAQIGNVLLVGDARNLGVTRDAALRVYEQRREQANRDLQVAIVAAAGDSEAEAQVRGMLSVLGQYEALAAQAVLLDGNAHHKPGQAPRAALDLYQQADGLMRTWLVPLADSLNDSRLTGLDSSDQAKRAHARKSAVLAEMSGLVLIAALIALHLTISRRFNRRLSPAIALGTVLATGAVVVSLSLLASGYGDLRRAKTRDFDSAFALSQARAISYDANADEIRYLVDPEGRSQFDQAFFAKSQRIAPLSGDLDARRYPGALEQARNAYYNDRTVWFHGYLGTEFGDLTASDEKAAAERVLNRYVLYEQDHADIRAKVESGDLRSAITLKTQSVGPSGKFGDYSQSLDALVRLKQAQLTRHLHDGESPLSGWSVIPWLVVIAVIGLAVAGVSPRLREYR